MEKQQELLTLINQRISKVTDLIKKQNADAMIIFNQANYRYLTNFTGEEAQLILTSDGERYLLSDSRFAGQKLAPPRPFSALPPVISVRG